MLIYYLFSLVNKLYLFGMKANNIATIVEDSTAFFPTRFKECTAQIWGSILTMIYGIL